MGRPAPTKTFGLMTPTDLFEKLLFDIKRLRSALSTADSKYAAFDCAVDSLHLADWVLHAVGDARHQQLSGKKRSDFNVVASFVDVQAARLPNLKHCYPIGNSVKHRELRNDKALNLWTGSTVRLFWSEPNDEVGDRIVGAKLQTYVEINGDRLDAVELFEAMAHQWQAFLVEEALFEFRPDYTEE